MRLLVAFLSLSLVFQVGCDNQETKQSSPKFEVADSSSSTKTSTSELKPTTSETISESQKQTMQQPTNAASESGSAISAPPNPSAKSFKAASSNAPKNNAPSSLDVGSAPPTAASPPTITPPPSFSPTITQGGDNRSFMTITKPADTDLKSQIDFLKKIDVAIRDLINAVQNRQVSESQFMDRASALGNMKIETAQLVLQQAETQQDRDLAVISKLEALSQMVGMGDTRWSEELRNFAPQAEEVKDAELAHQGHVILAMFYLTDYATGRIQDAQPILNQLDKAWADKKLIGIPDLRLASEVLTVLNQKGDQTAFDSVRAKTIASLGDSDNIQVAQTVWQMRVMNSREFLALNQEMELLFSGTAEVPVEQFTSTLQAFTKEYPGQMTCAFLAAQAVEVEFSGQVKHAQAIFDVIRPQIAEVKNADLRTQIDRTIADFEKRASILGSTLDLKDLNVFGGVPLDWSQYQGKVVLVDIWATWCGPCIGEFPNLKSIYKEYKDKGFEIIGVSVDDTMSDLQEFLQRDPLPWTIAFSSDPNRTGFDTPLAKELGVSAIPFLVLVDRSGKVVGLHKRGKALEAAVAELIQQ